MKFNYTMLKRPRESAPRKVTQIDAAMVIGVKHPSYNRKENGKEPISLEQLQKLADFYQVDLSAFFEFDGSEDVQSSSVYRYGFLAECIREVKKMEEEGRSEIVVVKRLVKLLEMELISLEEDAEKASCKKKGVLSR